MSNQIGQEDHLNEALPYPFRRGPGGLYRIAVSKDDEETEEWLCSDFTVLGTGCDSANTNWGRVISVIDPDGSEHRLFLSLALIASSTNKILGHLSEHGMDFSRARTARSGFLDLLSAWKGTDRFLVTNNVGWASKACDAFVLDNSAIIGNPKVFYTGHAFSGRSGKLAQGDIKTWKSAVAEKCVGNPVLLSAVSLAFCGPLLDLLEIDGFGLHLRGSSSSGKSTALAAAVSVWGGPDRMSSWLTTANALEVTATSMNSTLLALDELGQVSGKDAYDAAYQLGNGRGKRRANASGHGTPSASWRVPVLSSGELTLSEKISESGGKPMTGQEVRIIDVAADFGKFGVFDELHGEASPAIFAEKLKAGAMSTYGLAGPQFVEACLKKKTELKQILPPKVTKLARQFLSGHSEPADGPTQRVAASLALVAMSGEVATRWGLTGWPAGAALAAAHSLFDAWVDRRSAAVHSSKTDWTETLNEFLENNLSLGFSAVGANSFRNELGFWDNGFLYLNKQAWSKAFEPANQTLAAETLTEQGILVRDGHHYKTKAPRAAGNRNRCYRLNRARLSDPINMLITKIENGGTSLPA